MTATTPAKRTALAAIHYGLPMSGAAMLAMPDLLEDGLIIQGASNWDLTDTGRIALAAQIETSNAEDRAVIGQADRLLGALDTIRKALA